ncbi:MAG: hypothetical protein AAF957_15115 [Planctomycetota bacterium]
MCSTRARLADRSESVVDTTAVDQSIVRPHDVRFRHVGRTQLAREVARRVEEQRERDLVLVAEGAALGRRQERIGQDAVELDA